MNPLTNLLTNLKNHEAVGKEEAVSRPTSKLSTEILKLIQKHGYIGEFEIIDDGRGKVYKIKLLHKINNCGAISPRYPIKKEEVEKLEHKYLPAQGFGIMIISTPKGLVTHAEAKEKKLGGRLIAFVY